MGPCDHADGATEVTDIFAAVVRSPSRQTDGERQAYRILAVGASVILVLFRRRFGWRGLEPTRGGKRYAFRALVGH